ncbi:type II inositol 1,4,5-trisphosphate 5-phosphatase-like [Hyalella azteca]|uniref:Type II inositol 1,4,5-trisphosphate 5-phosphatase-like n=1 Tax=Hyalella azteca TaxID=294128 RepID=A0A979FGE1_HYAAZ|nr:type II inositol 1,4,5-trisphosphate 5-phosphatase-like [Hyalella azteca]
MPSRELGVSVHSIAQALLVFLEALPEPVVPCSLYPAALRAAAEGYLPAKQVVSQMPDYHRNVFTYLMAFLNELLVHRHENKLDASTLAMVFGLVILREAAVHKPGALAKPDHDSKKKLFVYHFLVNE